jgi:hypothetical protein
MSHTIVIHPPKVNRRGFTVKPQQARCKCGQWSYTLKGRSWPEENAMWNAFEFHKKQVGVR